MAEKLISQHLQDAFLFLAITNLEFLRLTRDDLDTNFITADMTSILVDLCFNYYDRCESAPKDHFHDEVVKLVREYDTRKRKRYAKYIKKIQNMPPPDLNYVLGRVSDFIKARVYEEAAISFAEDVEEGNLEAAEEAMLEALKAGIFREEVGLDYMEDLNSAVTRRVADRDPFLFKSGIESLDKMIGGFQRNRLVSVLGAYKGTKSWALCHLGKRALLKGCTVVHISHELSKEELEERYDMMFGALRKSDSPNGLKEVKVRMQKPSKKTDSFMYITRMLKRNNVNDYNAIKKVRALIKRFGGKLIIKKFAMGACKMSDMERYLRKLELQSVYPDVIINDYADLMGKSRASMDNRDHCNEMYIRHKKIADEKAVVVITASQVTRAAVKRPIIRMSDVAEDIRKIANADLVLAVGATPQQERSKEKNIFVIANRTGEQGGACVIGQCLDIGQFHMWDRPYDWGDDDEE